VTLEELRLNSGEIVIRPQDFYLSLRNLNHVRKAKGVTWPALAQSTQVSQSTLKGYAGGGKCSPERADKIANALGVDVRELKGEG
jgi:hypothetical protein